MRLFRPTLLCVVFSCLGARVACAQSESYLAQGRAPAAPGGGSGYLEEGRIEGQAEEMERLKAALARKDEEIAKLRLALTAQVQKQSAVLAISDQAGISRGNRELTPSSSLSAARAEQIARLINVVDPGTSLSTVLPTGSMRPFFDEKAVLLMEKAPFEQLKVGDIVTYKHPRLGVPVSHRLIEKSGDRFWVKGDANGKPDNVYVTRENYISRVFAVIYTQGD